MFLGFDIKFRKRRHRAKDASNKFSLNAGVCVAQIRSTNMQGSNSLQLVLRVEELSKEYAGRLFSIIEVSQRFVILTDVGRMLSVALGLQLFDV